MLLDTRLERQLIVHEIVDSLQDSAGANPQGGHPACESAGGHEDARPLLDAHFDRSCKVRSANENTRQGTDAPHFRPKRAVAERRFLDGCLQVAKPLEVSREGPPTRRGATRSAAMALLSSISRTTVNTIWTIHFQICAQFRK
jgi:hypothetical protein